MPRNAAGVYSLPEAAVVSGTTIESAVENSNNSDLATEITSSLDRSGRGGMLAALRLADGTLALPGLAFVLDTNTGIYRSADDTLVGVAGGVAVWSATATVLTLPLGATLTGHLLFTDNTYDIGASGATRPRTGYFGTSVVAPTFTGNLTGSASLNLLLTGGTLTGHLLFTDNTYDIGASGATRPRTGYFGTSVVAPTFTGDVTGNADTATKAGVPQNSQSGAYTTVLADANKHILHPTADNNPRTFTIDSNANVAYPVGTCITFVNEINTLTIAITSDTLVLAGAGTTGSRTLAAMGIATALKKTSTSWIISGTGLT